MNSLPPVPALETYPASQSINREPLNRLHPGLLARATKMSIDGTGADAQVSCDILRSHVAGKQPEDGFLPRGEGLPWLWRGPVLCAHGFTTATKSLRLLIGRILM